MKKLALAFAAATMLAGTAGAAFADKVEVPGVGSVTVNEDGDVIYADGNADNGLGPLTGFIQVKASGGACADDNGSKDNGDDTPDSASPTCV